jgi:hypothetical protein
MRMRRKRSSISLDVAFNCADILSQIMTEQQKMEEGKRMFSIFAARMFEQRVLSAYKAKLAQDRQLQFIRELDDEAEQKKEADLKRQAQSQKKKEKKKWDSHSIDLSDTHVWIGCRKLRKTRSLRPRRLHKLLRSRR